MEITKQRWRKLPRAVRDLACHKECPLTVLIKSIPESLGDVLELYYACKLCSAAQAYLEQETFVEHVQECHPDYYSDPADFPMPFTESKSVSCQATEEDILLSTSEEGESAGYEDIVLPMQDEEPDQEPFLMKEQDDMIKAEESPFLRNETPQKYSRSVLNAIKSVHGMKNEKIDEEPEQENGYEINEIFLKIEADTQHSLAESQQSMELNEADDPGWVDFGKKQPKLYKPKKIKGEKVEKNDDPDWDDFGGKKVGKPKKIKEESSDSDSETVGGDGPFCAKCKRSYVPKHHSSCKKPHTTEKPSCDAFVCVARNSEKVYPCRFCKRIFLERSPYDRHLSKHLDDLNMKCDLCRREFNSQRKLLTHLRMCKGVENIKCKFCSKQFNSRIAMRKHRRQVHTHKGSYICDICGRAFNRRSNLITHLAFHSNDRPHKCPHCPMSFKAKPNLLRHSFRHTGNKPHVCETCGKSFADKTTLKRHSQVHTEEYSLKLRHCKYCEAVLKSDRLLMKHIQNEHKDLEPNAGYSCDICFKIFRDKHNMESHKMIHTGERPFACKVCLKTFRKNSDLTIHSRVHTGIKPFKCEFCDMAFTTNSNLQKHRMSHTGERPHQCQMCQRRFIDKSHLNRHYLTHTGEKPHVCAVCERGFATKAQCQQHMLVHTGEKPFICGACGKTFRQKAKAQKHRCLWKVIQKPILQYAQNQPQEVLVQMGENVTEQGENQIAVRVIEPDAVEQGGGEQIAYHLVEPGNEDSEQVAYQIIESGDAGAEQIAVRVVEEGNDQIAYQIVGEAGNSEELSEIAARVLQQTAGQPGEQVAYQVVDEEGNQIAIRYENQVTETVQV